MKKEMFEELTQSLKEAVEHAEGKRELKTTTLPRSPQKLTNEDLSDLISQQKAAELRGVSRAAIADLIKRGRLEVVDIGGKRFLSQKAVLGFESQQGKKKKKGR